MMQSDYLGALADLRLADTQSRMSGNRFFDGVFLPAYACAALLTEGAGSPEAARMLVRARAHQRLAHSWFYDSQVTAAEAVQACVEGRGKQAERLLRRSQYERHGILRLYEGVCMTYGVATSASARPNASLPR